MAAVLACGEGAVLSHRSAAMLLGLRSGAPLRAEVTTRSRRRRAGIVAHRAVLADADRTVRHGIPVTSDARTLVDLGHALDEDEFERVVREAQYQRRFVIADLEDALRRRPCASLRRLLTDVARVQSDLERRFLRLCDRYGIPRPLTQQRIGPRTVDFLWARERVIAETDGWRAHGTRRAFQADRSATNALQVAGHTVLRFTDQDLRRRHGQAAAQVLAALGYSGGNRPSTHSAPSGSRRYERPPTRT
jgi:very-short-patch-repair endonuclease